MLRLACHVSVAISAGASMISDASGTDSGFGTARGSFGERRTASAGTMRDRGVEKSDKAAHDRQTTRHRTVLDSYGAMREEGSEIGRRQRAQRRQGRRLAEMLGEEIEKKGKVATIGGNRMRRSPPLTSQPVDPQLDRLAQILASGKPRAARVPVAPEKPTAGGRR